MPSAKKTLDDSQKKIVEDYYEWMVKKVRWNWVRNWPDLEEEILSASNEGIMSAVFYFDKSKSSSFNRSCILYVNRMVKRAIKREIKERQFIKALLGRVASLHVAGRRADPWAERGR